MYPEIQKEISPLLLLAKQFGSRFLSSTKKGLAVCYGLAEDRIWANLIVTDDIVTQPGIMGIRLRGIIPIAGCKFHVSET